MNRPAFPSVLLAFAALALAGCAAQFADLANLSDPRTIVDESVNGQTVTLPQGNALVVRLPVKAGDGNRWELAPLSVTPLGSPIRFDYQPTVGAGSLPPVPPYSGVLAWLNPPASVQPAPPIDASKPAPLVVEGDAVLRLRGITPGNATVQLDYRRADAPGATPVRSVRFDVAVR